MKLELHNFQGQIVGDVLSVSCNSAKARYHIWLREVGMMPDVTVYKNPPTGTPHGSAGDFRTRRLSRLKGEGKAVAAALMAQAPALIVQAREQEAKNAAVRRADHETAVRNARIAAAAPHMFELLKRFVVGDDSDMRQAKDLIKNIERPIP